MSRSDQDNQTPGIAARKFLWIAGLTMAAAVAASPAISGETLVSGSLDGEAHTWERLQVDGDPPAFFSEIASGTHLLNLHGFKDSSAMDPMGSVIVSVTASGNHIIAAELGYYDDSRTGPDFRADGQVGEIEYEIHNIDIDGDTAHISGVVSGELHYAEDRLRGEYDSSRTRTLEVEFDTTLPRQ